METPGFGSTLKDVSPCCSENVALRLLFWYFGTKTYFLSFSRFSESLDQRGPDPLLRHPVSRCVFFDLLVEHLRLASARAKFLEVWFSTSPPKLVYYVNEQ